VKALKPDQKKRALFIVVSSLSLTASYVRAGQTQPVSLPKLYVGEFQPVERARNGFGPIHALNSDIRRIKADSNAARLSTALTEELRKLGAHTDPQPAGASHRPNSGWLVQGVFYAMDENSRLISVPLVSSGKGPNVEVSVTITDCSLNPDIPFAVIGTETVLKGQGTAISWNPYVAAAKFVLHQVKGQDSIAVLAAQIAQKIIDENESLLAHDLVKLNNTSSR
jgi:hypothetical protein